MAYCYIEAGGCGMKPMLVVMAGTLAMMLAAGAQCLTAFMAGVVASLTVVGLKAAGIVRE